jgi:hypothetical protein
MGLDGRLLSVTITLSDWVFNAIENKEVLTLHRDYFRLGKPIERRVYEIARKHCGRQRQWPIGIDKLHNKSGSQSTLREFRRAIKTISDRNHLPDYTIEFDPLTDQAIFKNRSDWWDKNACPPPLIRDTRTYETAKGLCRGSVDIYAIEQEWLDHWKKSGQKKVSDPDRAFLGFVSKKYL